MPKQAKIRFRFFDIRSALSCAAVVCLGNTEGATITTKTLTWLEGWLTCLEFERGHSLKRWKGVESKSGCNTNEKSCRKTTGNKLDLVSNCQNHWPMRASIGEDVKFRKGTWNARPPRKR